MKRKVSLSFEATGDGQYLQDHHNRSGEFLFSIWYGKGNTIEDLQDQINNNFDPFMNLDEPELSEIWLPNSVVRKFAAEIKYSFKEESKEYEDEEGNKGIEIWLLAIWKGEE